MEPVEVALLDEEPWWELEVVREYIWDVVDLRSGPKHRVARVATRLDEECLLMRGFVMLGRSCSLSAWMFF